MFYDKQSDKWTTKAYMMEGRENAACTVFEGNIVVSGGFTESIVEPEADDFHYVRVTSIHQFDSIEAYGHNENKWSSFPSMLRPRANHTAISISNKMFMIGGSFNYWDVLDDFEVFDGVTRKFTSIKIYQSGLNL